MANDAVGGKITLSSNTLDVLFINQTSISIIYPHITLSSTATVTLYTDLVEDNLGNRVNYSCRFALKDKWFEAKRNGSIFTCTLERDKSHLNEQVELWVISTVRGRLRLSLNKLTFSFSDLLQVIDVQPILHPYTTNNVSRMITLVTRQILLTSLGLQCKYVSTGDGVQYAPATIISPNEANCTVTKNIISNTAELVQVQLSIPSVQLDISTMTDFVFVKMPLKFDNVTDVIEGQFWVNVIMRMNLNIVNTNFTYQVSMLPNKYSSSPLKCDFPVNSVATCALADPNVQDVPITLRFIVQVSRGASSVFLDVQSITYFDKVNLIEAYPYMLSSTERQYVPAQVHFRASRLLNYVYYALSCQVQFSSSWNKNYSVSVLPVTSSDGRNSSYFACNIQSNGVVENATISLLFTYNNSKIMLSQSNATLYFVSPSLNSATMYQRIGPISGNTSVQVQLVPLPTMLWNNYDVQMYIVDRGQSIPMNSCQGSMSNYTLQCKTPALPSTSITDPRRTRRTLVDLVMNGLRGMTLGRFEYYGTPVVNTVRLTTNSSVQLLGSFPSFAVQDQQQAWIRYYNNDQSFSQIQRCSFIGSTTGLECLYPTNYPISGSLIMAISLNNQEQFTEITQRLLIETLTAPQFVSLSQTIFTAGQVNNVIMYGINFVQNNAPSATVIYQDAYFYAEHPTVFLNSTVLVVETPLFYEENVQYPRFIQVSVRFSNGIVLSDKRNMVIRFERIPRVILSPPAVEVNTILNRVQLIQFPTLQLKPEYNRLQLQFVHGMNSSLVYNLACDNAMKYCNISNAQQFVQQSATYHLVIRAYNSNNGIYSPNIVQTGLDKPFVVFNTPVLLDMNPKIILSQFTGTLTLRGSNFVDTGAILFGYTISTSSQARKSTALTASFTILPAQYVSDSFLSVSLSGANLNIGQMTNVSLSFNNGSTWIPFNQYSSSVIQKPVIYNVINKEDEDQASAFTFQETKLNVDGANFFTNLNTSIRIRFYAPKWNFDRTFSASNVTLNIISSNLMTFTVPTFDHIVPGYENLPIRFPFNEMLLGISFNDGYDYQFVNLLFMSVYRQPMIILPDVKFLPREMYNVVVQGKYFVNLTECFLAVSPTYNFTAPIYNVQPASGMATCMIDGTKVPPMPPGFTSQKVQLWLKNNRDQLSSNYYELTYYEYPSIVDVLPKSGAASGKFDLLLFVSNHSHKIEEIFVRVGRIEEVAPCVLVQNIRPPPSIPSPSSILRCFVSSREPGMANISITYNKRDWYDLKDRQFEFVPCKPGWGAKVASTECAPCPAGYFKATAGVYECQACPIGSYSETVGSTFCLSCPTYSTSPAASPSRYNCTCLPGYMVNIALYSNDNKPTMLDSIPFAMQQRCMKCPVGGNCSMSNTTVPLALPNYWYSKENVTSFSLCTPHFACPGGNYSTCAPGYTGAVCGRCDIHYFKWRNTCQQCQGGAWWRFLVGIIIVLFIMAFFFGFSSVKVSHISGMAIGFSFWQILSMFSRFPNINWPPEIDNSLSAASITNFNIDFLSPLCH
jgi:hypothetical protein